MSLVAYRFRCTDCSNETVLKESHIESSDWSINSRAKNSGTCPYCRSEFVADDEPVPFEDLDGIGETGAENLRSEGFETRSDIEQASDEELLDVGWIGDAALDALREL